MRAMWQRCTLQESPVMRSARVGRTTVQAPALGAGVPLGYEGPALQEDLARRMLLPAAISAATSYVTFAALAGTEPMSRDAWAVTRARNGVRTDVPVADVAWVMTDAIRAMEDAGIDRIAVCDAGRFVGVITATDLVELEDVPDQADPSRDAHSG